MSFIMHYELVNFDLSPGCNLHGGIYRYIHEYIPTYTYTGIHTYTYMYIYRHIHELTHKMHHFFIINIIAFSCSCSLNLNSLVVSIYILTIKVHSKHLNSSISLIIPTFLKHFVLVT